MLRDASIVVGVPVIEGMTPLPQTIQELIREMELDSDSDSDSDMIIFPQRRTQRRRSWLSRLRAWMRVKRF